MCNRATLVITAFLSVGLAACGDSTGLDDGASIRPQLMRLQSVGTTAAAFRADRPSTAEQGDYPWSSDIEITSLETPIRAIWLEGDGDEALVYECDADSNDGCLVDLAGPALQDLLGADAVNIDAGTYTSVAVSTCEDEGGYTSYLTGSVSFGDQTWVTKSATVLGSEGSAEAVAMEYSGCQRSYPMPEPVMVADTLGVQVALRLYFDIRDIAWASLGAQSTESGWIPGGCVGPQPGGVSDQPYLCVAYPDVAAVVDEVAPEIERYRINESATLGLIFHGTSGEFVGGFTRRYFAENMLAYPGFTADTPVEAFIDNGDDTYRLYTYGGSSGGSGPTGRYLDIAAFVRDTHGGMALDYQGMEFSYEAVRIQ